MSGVGGVVGAVWWRAHLVARGLDDIAGRLRNSSRSMVPELSYTRATVSQVPVIPPPIASYPAGTAPCAIAVAGRHALSSFMNLLRSRSTSSLSTINPKVSTLSKICTMRQLQVAIPPPGRCNNGKQLTVGPLDDIVQHRASRVTHLRLGHAIPIYMCSGRKKRTKWGTSGV